MPGGEEQPSLREHLPRNKPRNNVAIKVSTRFGLDQRSQVIAAGEWDG
jgi:hypothetical protein